MCNSHRRNALVLGRGRVGAVGQWHEPEQLSAGAGAWDELGVCGARGLPYLRGQERWDALVLGLERVGAVWSGDRLLRELDPSAKGWGSLDECAWRFIDSLRDTYGCDVVVLGRECGWAVGQRLG